MGEWNAKKLADVVELCRGFDLPTRSREPGPFPVLSAGITAGWHSEGPVRGPGFVVGRATNLGVPTWSDGDFWPLNTTLYAADFKGNDPRFLYHLFETTPLGGFDSGSVQPMLNRNYIAAVEVKIPDVATQRAIADVLGALDDKIATNTRMLQTSKELAAAEFARTLALGVTTTRLGERADFHNRRRVPLSSREREHRAGSVPYYGAAGRVDFVDEALFNEPLTLVGEDGTVMQDDGSPAVQYIWGPAWVNNHAHVLTGRSISTEMLKIALERSSVAHLVTGAVQPKLSMSNLKKLVLEIPKDTHEFEAEIQTKAALVRAVSDENETLAATRDQLIPLLMSGKLRVRDAEKAVEDVT